MRTDVIYTIRQMSQVIKDKGTMDELVIQLLGGSACAYTQNWVPIFTMNELFRPDTDDRFYTVLKFIQDKGFDPDDYYVTMLHSNYIVANVIRVTDETCEQIYHATGIDEFLVFRPKSLPLYAHGSVRAALWDAVSSTFEVKTEDEHKYRITYKEIEYGAATIEKLIDPWLADESRKGKPCAIIIPDTDIWISDTTKIREGFFNKYTDQGHIIVNHNECIISETRCLPDDRGYRLKLQSKQEDNTNENTKIKRNRTSDVAT